MKREFSQIDIDKKLKDIYNEAISPKEVISIDLDTNDEICLFKLGVLFSQGKSLHIKNVQDVINKIHDEQRLGKFKTYYMSSLYWATHKKKFLLKSSPNRKQAFIICPVANASQNQKNRIDDVILDFANKGYKVYYPARDTNQSPFENEIYTGGYNINCKNAIAISNSQIILIFYDRQSRGLFFDLGVLYSHMMNNSSINVTVINNEDINPLQYSDKILLSIISKNKKLWDSGDGKR